MDMEQVKEEVDILKQQWIDKACKWLKENADKYTWYNEFEGESVMTDFFIQDFRKIMEK